MTNTNKKLILVTGGSGYIAMFIMIALLKKGYRVRATLRMMSRQEEVKKMMKQGGIADFTDLDFVQTDLTKEEGWSQAMTGVDSVIHVASPTPLQRPDADDLMVIMAVDGVKFVMRAAKEAGVKRVVLTSASGAVLAGHKHHPEILQKKTGQSLMLQLMLINVLKQRLNWSFGNLPNLMVWKEPQFYLRLSWDRFLGMIFHILARQLKICLKEKCLDF